MLGPRREEPPACSGDPAGLALASELGSNTPILSPLVAKLMGEVLLTFASSTQLAEEEKRNSVKAKA